MAAELIQRHKSTDFDFRYYRKAGSDSVSLLLVPHGYELTSPPFAGDFQADMESLLQVKCVGDAYPDGFAQGRTMRNSRTTLDMRFDLQNVVNTKDETIIETHFSHGGRFKAVHILRIPENAPYAYSCSRIENTSDQELILEMLSSFSLGHISPFAPHDSSGRLRIHRFRSNWSLEGRHEAIVAEKLHLERSWSGLGVANERFGQVGSMPVRGFFPFVAVEDTQAEVFWGAQLLWPGSWQMEVCRKDYGLCISGGLADREFGHWRKTLLPGESFESPQAVISVSQGTQIESICERFVQSQRASMDRVSQEKGLPIVFNEYCSTWGKPNHEKVVNLAGSIKGLGVKYFVIDAGWYSSDGGDWGHDHGDWIVSDEKFPQGLAKTCRILREQGFVPGIWFEMETAGCGSAAHRRGNHFLRRDGLVLNSGPRCFWDFCDPWVWDYLSDRMIKLIKDCGIGYLKVDYNETIGFGVDGADSAGENLRQHIVKVQEFFAYLKRQLPELIIENCSSGGHRLEPSMMALTHLSSFSDAHETLNIPIIAANLHRLMLPGQSLIWAVIHKADSLRYISYNLSATFLGRMCLSGELDSLSAAQKDIVKSGCEFYRQISGVIANGCSRRFGPEVLSYSYPKGWQVISRQSDDGSELLIVGHSFAEAPQEEIGIPLPAGEWRIKSRFPHDQAEVAIADGIFKLRLSEDFCTKAVHLVLR